MHKCENYLFQIIKTWETFSGRWPGVVWQPPDEHCRRVKGVKYIDHQSVINFVLWWGQYCSVGTQHLPCSHRRPQGEWEVTQTQSWKPRKHLALGFLLARSTKTPACVQEPSKRQFNVYDLTRFKKLSKCQSSLSLNSLVPLCTPHSNQEQ